MQSCPAFTVRGKTPPCCVISRAAGYLYSLSPVFPGCHFGRAMQPPDAEASSPIKALAEMGGFEPPSSRVKVCCLFHLATPLYIPNRNCTGAAATYGQAFTGCPINDTRRNYETQRGPGFRPDLHTSIISILSVQNNALFERRIVRHPIGNQFRYILRTASLADFPFLQGSNRNVQHRGKFGLR